MKLKPKDIPAFLKEPPADIRAVLVYGPDGGLVRERARLLAATVVEDLSDPFRVAELDGAALAADPARLADEAAAVSMMGGRRVIRVRIESDTTAVGPFETVLDDAAGDALVVVEAGDLGPRAPLRKLFEGADRGAALPCYGDADEVLDRVVRGVLKAGGLGVSADALDYLAGHLGSDRQVTRGELEKIVLYKGGAGEVSLDDAMACVGDSAAIDAEGAALAAAEGDHGALDRALQRLFQEGMTAVGALRAAQRHFHRLHLAAALVEDGKRPDEAIAALRPPVFFKLKSRFARQLQAWPRPRAAQAMQLLIDAEADCKKTGMPDEAICARALFTLANAASRSRSRGAR